MIKTPETHPDHHVVGKYFGGHSTKTDKTEVFYCDSYDTAIGYWLTSVTIPGAPERKNVSERAISATYWPAENNEDYFWVTQWGVRVPKLPKDSFTPSPEEAARGMITKNAVPCGICQAAAHRYSNRFECSANPHHVGDLNVGIFSDLEYHGERTT